MEIVQVKPRPKGHRTEDAVEREIAATEIRLELAALAEKLQGGFYEGFKVMS